MSLFTCVDAASPGCFGDTGAHLHVGFNKPGDTAHPSSRQNRFLCGDVLLVLESTVLVLLKQTRPCRHVWCGTGPLTVFSVTQAPWTSTTRSGGCRRVRCAAPRDASAATAISASGRAAIHHPRSRTCQVLIAFNCAHPDLINTEITHHLQGVSDEPGAEQEG